MDIHTFARLDRFQLAFWNAYEINRQHGQRRGQARFNALAETAPELAEMIHETYADPFYIDDQCLAFDIELWGRAGIRDNPDWIHR